MIQFLKDNLDRQLQFLGLIIGFYALMILNSFIVDTLILDGMGINLYVSEIGGIGIWLATIFQTWVIIKYIMKK